MRRLIGGGDLRKSLHQLIYSHENRIKHRVIERVALMEMFRHKNGEKKFTKTYSVDEIEEILGGLSILKVLEDDYDYSEARINVSLARDIAC